MEPTDKRDVLERRRKTSRTRVLAVAFALGCLLGAGLAHVIATATTSVDPADRDRTPPAIVAVEPPEGTFLPAGPRSFRVAFSEILAASPNVVLTGPVNLTATEESFDGTTWRGAFPVPSGADGPYALQVDGARDMHGNARAAAALPYVVDAAPPRSRASVPANATALPFEVAWDAEDDGSGIERVELWARAEDGPWTLRFTSPDDRGTYRWDPGERRAALGLYALAVDRAGNREEPPTEPDASVAYDPAPPSASVVPSSRYWHRQPLALTAIAGPEVASVELRYHFAADNATWQGPFPAGNDTAPFTWTFPFPLGPGHYRLHGRATATDGAREADQTPAAAEVHVGYDVELPTARLVPPPAYWHAVPLEVTAEAADDRSGVASLDLFFAHRPNGTAAWSGWIAAGSRAEPPWTFPFDFLRGDGRYELVVRARDRAGGEEALPPPGFGEVPIGYNRDAPAAPNLALPVFVDPATWRTNLTWTAAAPADLVRFEIHAGTFADFAPDGAPCGTSATCLLEVARGARSAWAPLPTENATWWFRVRAVDDGGLAADSAAVGANGHGLGFDTPNTYATASPLPLGVAWSERIAYASGCVDCTDVFKVTLAAGDLLGLTLAVPPTGDFRLVVYDAAIAVVAKSQTAGLGVWESLSVELPSAGLYYIVVDWSNVFGPGNRNEGWYTLAATIA